VRTAARRRSTSTESSSTTLDPYISSLKVRCSASFEASAAHTIEVRVLGTKNAASSDKLVDLDAVVVAQQALGELVHRWKDGVHEDGYGDVRNSTVRRSTDVGTSTGGG
jgi:hypothetical protein